MFLRTPGPDHPGFFFFDGVIDARRALPWSATPSRTTRCARSSPSVGAFAGYSLTVPKVRGKP